MCFGAFFVLAVAPVSLGAAEPNAAAIEHFETKVRPVLIEQCHGCHGPKKSEAGMRLDSREAVLKGSEAGPVVVPGEPQKSKLIHAIHQTGALKMPPKGKLTAEAIEALTVWVKSGVPYPGGAAVAKTDPKTHWAYLPVRAEAPPAVNDKQGAPTAIDRFVQARLEAKGMSLAMTADARTLIRRVYFDLIGLPPSADEIERFVREYAAKPQAAYEALIDQLLASPHYGETQARHWLDLARYSDTKGYVFQEDRNYPYAYTYRDWVIRAFYDDMPYDRFIQLQLAADRLNPTDKRDLAAMGFLTVGRRFLNNIHDIIDDRLDVTCRTFMGVTVGCARCHDHKYDPIPAKDYYSLYGVFASSVEPKDLPLIGEPERNADYLRFEQDLKKREDDLDALRRKLWAAHIDKLRKADTIAAYLVAARDIQGKSDRQIQTVVRERDLIPDALGRWRGLVFQDTNLAVVFGPLKALADLNDAEFEAKAPATLAKALQAKVNSLVAKAFEGSKPATFKDAAAIYGKLIAAHYRTPTKSEVAQAQIAEILGPNGPAGIPYADADKIFNRDDRNKTNEARKKIDSFKAASPFAPPRAMVLADGPLQNPYVFLRGSPGNRGPNVPRQFLEVLSSERKPFADGSGRLDLAKAIADPKNPLTARVLVNRIWITHFGHGLVRTPSDFGLRSEPPTHPELLDYLASQFIAKGWSIKQLHRAIVLSRTYQQSSDCSAEQAKLDPENRLLARQNRRRLDFEQMRDGMLRASGQLDTALGGKSIDLFKEPFTKRRAVYGFVDRQNLAGTLRIFDFASPDTHSPQRFTTTVPQQALFLMNSPFVLNQAKALVSQSEIANKAIPEERIAALVRAVYGRTASRDEIGLLRAFLASAEEKAPTDEASTWLYGYGGYNEAKKQVTFAPLPHWTGSAWQGGPQLPDRVHGWVILNDIGGHPGKNPDHAIIRRWVAPRAGDVTIDGSLQHGQKEGDGVRGRIVSSRSGLAGSWKVHNSKADTSVRIRVEAGDTIDFIVDCIGEESNDSFLWSPIIKLGEVTWDADRDFGGPRSPTVAASRWEQLAQVLLLSNEFVFID
jgi:Protein of unknown function (DUF1553)/Protein of unknown function (DUF1549)/Planctomycete cytochrome C